MLLIADLVRGRNIVEAMNILKLTPKAGAKVLLEVIKSSRANAIEEAKRKNLKITPELFFISEIKVEGGPIIKRYRPMSMGRAGLIRRRTTHITVILSDDLPKERIRRRA